jgi:hypothetical protein
MKRLIYSSLLTCLATVAMAQQGQRYAQTHTPKVKKGKQPAYISAAALLVDSNLKEVNNGIRIKGGSASSAALGQNHLVIKADTAGRGGRVHIEPNGYYNGVQAKIDLMGGPFDEMDPVAGYSLGNLFFKKGNFSGSLGTNGIFFIGAKSSLGEGPIHPSINIGFNDDNANSVPMKLFYMDHAQTQWYNPMTGMWRSGKAYITGEYITASNRVYLATNTATAGATQPTHTSGTVSDGGVSWSYITSVDITGTTTKPVVIIGNRADMPKFGFATVRLQYSQPTLSWNGVKHNFLNATNGLQYSFGTESNDFFIRNITASTYLKFTSAGGIETQTQPVTDSSPKIATTANVMSHFLTASATLDFISTAAQSSSELNITVTGAADGDVVSVGVPNASNNANSCFTARVSATNTVSVKFNNYSTGSIDPASGNFKVTVFK